MTSSSSGHSSSAGSATGGASTGGSVSSHHASSSSSSSGTGGTGGGSGGTGGSCSACTAGATRCSGTQVETCVQLANGCTSWGAPASCPNAKDCSAGACPDCTDACTLGATQCSSNQIETCVQGTMGCTVWGSAQSLCLAGDTCSQGQCCEGSAADSWPADGSAADAIGGQNGTLVNGVAFGTGKIGQAFVFSGNNQYATFGATAGNFGSSDFTIEFWMNTSSTRTEDFLTKRSTCAGGNFLNVSTTSGRIRFELDQDATQTKYTDFTSSKAINDGLWHYITFIRIGAAVSVYIDGALDTMGAAPSTISLSNTANFELASGPCVAAGATNDFTGSLDQINLFKVALTQPQIQATFASGSTAPCIVQ